MSTHCTPQSTHCTPQSTHCTPTVYTLYPHSLHTAPLSLHTVPHSLQTVLYSLHTVRHSLHTVPYSLHTVPHSLHTGPHRPHTLRTESCHLYVIFCKRHSTFSLPPVLANSSLTSHSQHFLIINTSKNGKLRSSTHRVVYYSYTATDVTTEMARPVPGLGQGGLRQRPRDPNPSQQNLDARHRHLQFVSFSLSVRQFYWAKFNRIWDLL